MTCAASFIAGLALGALALIGAIVIGAALVFRSFARDGDQAYRDNA